MSNQFRKATGTLVVSAFASLLLALGLASSALAQQQPPPKPPKKKLQASSNFAQYAGRDASNRLIAGGATRDMTVTDAAGALSIKGREAYEAGRYEEAVADFKKVTEMKPDSALAFYNLGSAFETAGHNKEAIESYKRTIVLADKSMMKPDDKVAVKAMSFYNMGNTLAADKQPKEAAEAYKQVIALVPDQAVAYYNLGLAYAAAAQTTEAVESFKRAVKLKPDYAEADFNLGIAYGNLERYKEAADAFKSAVQIRPDYAEAHFNLGLAYLALDDKADAQAEVNALQGLKSPLAAKLKSFGE